MCVLNHSMSIQRVKVILRLRLAILVQVSVVCGVERHRVDVEGARGVKERGEGKVISTLLAIVLSSEPLGIKVLIRRLQHSLHEWLGCIKFNFTLNVVGCLVVLSPQAIDRDIMEVALECLIPEGACSLYVEPVNVYALF